MNWKRFFFVAFALLIVLSMGSTKLAAQATTSTGGIQGAVTDAQGGVVPNAKVTITNKATGQVIDLVTSSAGEFSAGALGAGTYVVRIETPNFKTAETTLVVQVGQITPANTRLEIGGSATVVEVTGAEVSVNTEQTQIAGTLTFAADRKSPDQWPQLPRLGATRAGRADSGRRQFRSHQDWFLLDLIRRKVWP